MVDLGRGHAGAARGVGEKNRPLARRLQLPQSFRRARVEEQAVMHHPPQIEDKGVVAVDNGREGGDKAHAPS